MVMSREAERAMFAKFKKGDFVRIKDGFDAGQVGKITGKNTTNFGEQGIGHFITVRLANGKLSHGFPNAYEKITPTSQQKKVIALREKLQMESRRL